MDLRNNKFRDEGEASSEELHHSRLEPSQSIILGEDECKEDEDPTQGAADVHDVHAATSHRTAERQEPSSSSFLSVILRLEVEDLPALGVPATTRASVVWKCVESSDMGLLPTFLLQLSNGLEAEYSPARGVVVGTAIDRSPFRYEFSSLHAKAQQIGTTEWLGRDRTGGTIAQPATRSRVEATLGVLVRFCQCLALRSMQLRRQALRLDAATLPMVHYDTLPETLLALFRRPSFDSTLTNPHTRFPTQRHQSQSHSVDGDDHSRTQQSAVIAGVGEGVLDTLSGDLRLVFVDGSELALGSDGTRLRFKYALSSHDDEFELVTSSGAAAGFLPTAVRKRLESVPVFIRKLRSASSSRC